MKSALIIVLLALVIDTCLGQSALNVSKLHDDLMTLKPTVRPVHDLTQPTQVNVSFHLNSIISLDTVSQKLVSNGWMSVVWQNDYMTWDPEDYGGITKITPPADNMWRPRLTVLNSMKELKAVGEDYIVLNLLSNGLMVWFPAERFETFCRIDVTFFPFDLQRCSWDLFLWAELLEEVVLRPSEPYVHLDTYQESGEWNLMSSKTSESIMYAESDQFSVLHFEITLRRRPTLISLTVLLPMFVLGVANVFVFTIPSESGERLSYSMTTFLAVGVFMSFIVDLMPSSSETLSIMAISMSCQMILSGVCVLLCILSLRLFHRDSHKHPVPPILQSVIVFLEMMLCLDPPSQRPHSFPQSQTQVISSDSSGGFYGAEVKGSRLKGQLDRWAQKRKEKQEAYTQPQDMTWQRVSRTLDKLLFRLFFSLVIASSAAYFSAMIYNYNNYS